MRSKLLATLCIFLTACGSGGSDSKIEEGAVTVQPATVPNQTYCEHQGNIYVCDAVCVPAEDVEAVEEVQAPASDGLVSPFKAITIGGNITIIAECGSNVTFDVADNTSTSTSTPATQ